MCESETTTMFKKQKKLYYQMRYLHVNKWA